MIAYFNGQYLPINEISISPNDRGWLFADSLYEVIRTYDGRLFCPDEHIARMRHGASQLRFPSVDFDALIDVAKELILRNELQSGDATIYIQITRGVAPRDHSFPVEGTPPTVFVKAEPFNAHPEKQHNGISVITVPDLRWQRCDIKTTALTANVLANQKAREQGAHEALFVRNGVVVEGTHTNFVAIIDGVLITHPRTVVVLPGVTLKVIIRLCSKLGVKVEERPVHEEELDLAQEMFVVGTTTEITPVIRVNQREVGDGKPGPLTRKIQKAFDEYVRNND